MNQRLIEFLGLLGLLLVSLLIGMIGALYAKQLVSWRMQHVEARGLKAFLPIAESAIRILSTVVIVLCFYLLSKMPLIYNHCVRPSL